MSAITRSSSSSPDVLGPPGDAEYLISSPIKPFTGRQSFYSPAFSARKPTPAKRPRLSLSPTKSAHSIRFDDISLPLKDQQDGNVSPWRIRVTLEATQDEENEREMQLSPSRKRHRPTTVTTMVPLKDGRSPLAEKTPSRSRGRPRKSDAKPLNGSPWPASPGNTPGRPGETPKRKPGRPRKNTPRPAIQGSPMIEDEASPAPEPLHLLETEEEPQIQFSPMDIVEDRSVEPVRNWSPLNIAENGGLDSDSLGADDLPVADLTGPMQTNRAHLNTSATREYGRTTYDTPIITEQQYLGNEENINSTPSKMPSPTRERRSSSVRSARDAGMASSPRTYPTPTPTSSLAEEENQAREAQGQQERENDDRQPLSDPTDEHEEFDSIMESEGFTMVSLDTLPSAQQFGLGSNASRATDNAARVLQDRHNGRIGDRLKRKLPGISDLQSDNHSSTRPSPVTNGLSPGSRLSSHARQELNGPAKLSPAGPVSYPDLPPTSSPRKEQPQFEEEEEARSGISLEKEPIPLDDIEEESEDIEEEGEEDEEEELDEVHVIPNSSQLEREEIPQTDTTDRMRSQREAEWHEERQAVSRNAQDALDSNRMIYIDSDQNASEDEGLEEDNEHSDHLQSDFGSIGEEDHRQPGEFEEDNAFSDHLQSDFGSIGEEDRRQPEIFEEDRPLSDHLQSDFGSVGGEERREPKRFETIDEQEEPEGFEQFADEEVAGSVDPENIGYSKPGPVLSSPSSTKWPLYDEPKVSDGEDNGYDDIWRQEPEYPKLETQHVHEPEPEPIANYETEMEDEEDGFDDIWQQEARDNSYLSHHSDNQLQRPAEEAASPWRQIAANPSSQNHLSSSPAYVDLERDDLRHLNQTQIRKLREREVDLSALLAADDTPNRARYYNGTSTPRSILRSATQHSSINGSALKSQSGNPGKRVRLQPLSQSPEREPEDEQESPIFRHNYSQQEAHINDVEEIGSVSDGASNEAEPAHGDITITPQHQRQSDVEPQGSSWFQRITSLTPRWLKAPAHSEDDESSSVSEDDPRDGSEDEPEDGQVDQGELSLQSPLEVERTPQSIGLEQGHGEAVSSVEEEDEDEGGRSRFDRSISSELVEDNPANMIEEEHDSPKGPRPLAVFGYFSNDHYLALRRIYRIAKRHPERFPLL
ncbi:hypothetical protein N7509_009070 [Penicillium cosmopolitanum]|uniref:Uncharacterized protein n=1 Tax=Penicillium cosmopolitanum TaxID=1131564 RepID=A0A9W9VNU9_9EURO|nr:uncharacterized protein N7509_009070 [Penicillium cosmopolitanum]KAJ5386529.1 hypothetical protein N7509_009070 [Penicillium cosmopolitanum]